MVSTLVGSTSGSADGTGTAASFENPQGVTTDNAGNLYVTDRNNHRIRKIVIATGEVTTLAGSTLGFADGTGTGAKFVSPNGITIDNAGNLYVVDQDDYRIRKIVIATGVVTTIAGTGAAGAANGISTAASFQNPRNVIGDNAGNLYVTDGYRIRKIVIATGEVTTFAGSIQGYTDDIGTAASFNYPIGITTDNAGNLYVTDNHRIRKIVIATGVVTTIAGTGSSGSADGIGTAASFNYPNGITTDNAGNIYVADYFNHRIRKIFAMTYTIAPNLPAGLAFDGVTGAISGTPTTPTTNTTYTVTTQNACGSTNTTIAFVIDTPCISPTIITQPTPASACIGANANATFTVAASGTGLTYQWQKDGANIVSTTNATLTLTNVTAANAGSYACIVTGTCSAATSSAVMLTVNALPAITYSGVSATYLTGTNEPMNE